MRFLSPQLCTQKIKNLVAKDSIWDSVKAPSHAALRRCRKHETRRLLIGLLAVWLATINQAVSARRESCLLIMTHSSPNDSTSFLFTWTKWFCYLILNNIVETLCQPPVETKHFNKILAPKQTWPVSKVHLLRTLRFFYIFFQQVSRTFNWLDRDLSCPKTRFLWETMRPMPVDSIKSLPITYFMLAVVQRQVKNPTLSCAKWREMESCESKQLLGETPVCA